MISAGFAEVESGRGLQDELVAAAGHHALPVCGPNCNGIVGMWGRYALWGDALAPHEDPGGVVLISQSGNVAVNALATRRGLRFHTVIASGNQAVLSAATSWRLSPGSTTWRPSLCTWKTMATRPCAMRWRRAPMAGCASLC